MIKVADHNDTLIAVALLRKFLSETTYTQAEEAAKDLVHLSKLVWTCLQYGYVWIAYVDQEPAGILMSIKEPNLWYPKAQELRELVWYVRPEYRKSSLGGKLFLNYTRKAERLLEQGIIQGYFTTRMDTTDPIDLESRGFRLTERTYLKE